jgi:plastocyanin
MKRGFYAGVMVAAMLGGCVAPAAPHAGPVTAVGPYTVLIDNFTYSPATLKVPAGTRVTWINRDDVPHTVTDAAEPRVMDSAALDTDERYAVTFTQGGVYTYFCKLHPHMTGTIVVK